jgi:hypothetical protein
VDYASVSMVVGVYGGPEERSVTNLQGLNFGFAEHKLRVGTASHIRGSGIVGVAAAAADDDDDDIVAGPGIDVHAVGAADDEDGVVASSGIDVHAADPGAGLGYLSCDP